MARINIEIPDGLHTDAKVEATKREMTLKDFVKESIENEVNR